jgi:hypothetical protein
MYGLQGEQAMGALILLDNEALVAVYIGTLAYVVPKPRMRRPRDGPDVLGWLLLHGAWVGAGRLCLGLQLVCR